MSVTYLSSHTHIAGRKCMQPRRRSLALVPAAAVGALVACALALVLALKRSRPPPEMATAAAAALALPPIGLGTFGLSPAKAGPAVRSALAAGYRALDCAPVYFNEREIGDALSAELVPGGAIRREDLWVTSKLASPFHRGEHVGPALRKTLTDLKLEYLDLYLVHWPVAFRHVSIDPDGPRGWDGPDGAIDYSIDDSDGGRNIDPSVTVGETWSAMEELVDQGLVRNIGVSNFPAALLRELLAGCRIAPLVNQVELHPYLQQRGLVDCCRESGVGVQAYSPLGTPGYRDDELGEAEPSVLDDPVLVEMARGKGVSVARLCVAWALRRGTALNAKSASAERQEDNLAALTDPVELTDADMELIDGLDRGHRYFRPEDWWGAAGAVFD